MALADQRRSPARLVFGRDIVTDDSTDAALDLALRGSVLRWFVLAAGLVAGVPLLLAVNSVNRRYFARTRRRPSDKSALIPFSVPIGAIGVVVGHARATIEIDALALGAGYLATLGFLAVRVVRKRRTVALARIGR